MRTAVAVLSPTLAERTWAKVEKRDDHWWWTGGTNKRGYGVIGLGGRDEGNALAHRVVWRLVTGEWPVGVLRHECDIPPCVWPKHLIDGTQLENVHDAIERGRAVPPPHLLGEACGSTKLTAEKVLEIRTLLDQGCPQRNVAETYGVSRSLVGMIGRREGWAWLGDSVHS